MFFFYYRIPSPAFKTAGSKHEIKTITCQLVTANQYLDPKKLKCDLKLDSKVAFGNFTYTDKPLQQESLKVTRKFSSSHTYNNF